MMVVERRVPRTSCLLHPNIFSARGFHSEIHPRLSMAITASNAPSTIKRMFSSRSCNCCVRCRTCRSRSNEDFRKCPVTKATPPNPTPSNPTNSANVPANCWCISPVTSSNDWVTSSTPRTSPIFQSFLAISKD